MNVRSILHPTAKLLALTTLLMVTAGCSFFSAVANPKAAWALQEPTPMSVILRRAEVARVTAAHVDRLMSATPVNKDSKWLPKLALKKADVTEMLKQIGRDLDYAIPPGTKGMKLRVVHAEAWAKVLSGLCPHENKFPTLFHAVNVELGSSFGDVAGQAKAVAKLKADLEGEKKALDQKDIAADAKEAHEKKKKELEEQISKAEQELRPKVEAFMSKLKDETRKAPPDVKKQLSRAMVAFKRAVEDARMANSVALLRYPMAMPSMPQELQSQAKRIVADVVEQRTGHRPTLEKFEPDIKLEGGSVKLTLNGLPPEAIAGLKPDQLLEDVTERAKAYVTKVLTLTVYAAETEEMLSLEGEVIKNTMESLEVDESKVEDAGEDLAEIKVEIDEATAAGAAKAGAKAAKPVRSPVPPPACPAGKEPAKHKKTKK